MPFSSTTNLFQEKVTQAIGILDELDIDCWLTFVRETTETGDPILPLILGQPLTWQSALILTRTGERIAIVGKYEDAAVRGSGGGVWKNVLPYVQSIRSPLTTTLARIDPRSIAVNYSIDDVKADGLSHGMMLMLQSYLKDSPYAMRLTSADAVIRALRSRKSAGEVQRIRRAIGTTEEMFKQLEWHVRIGMTERAISQWMHAKLDANKLETAWERDMCPIVTTGPNSMIGHGTPSDTLCVEPGNILHLDLGVRQNQYCSDIQRCWYIPRPDESSPPAAVQHAFDTVVNAINAAAAALKAGVECWTVDQAARQVIINAGYPEYQHATGHNVGRAAHDGGGVLGPRWERYGNTPMYRVELGNVYTLELGIDNVDGRGYLGLEEMVLVTDTGVEWLTTPQRTLPVLNAR